MAGGVSLKATTSVVFWLSCLLVLSINTGFVQGQGAQCIDQDTAFDLWALPFRFTSSPVSNIGVDICNYESSCCDQANLFALRAYYQARNALTDAFIESSRQVYKLYNIRQSFNNGTNTTVDQIPSNYRAPVNNFLDKLQSFYTNLADNMQTCYHGSRDYYAGVLCGFCSSNYSSWLDIEFDNRDFGNYDGRYYATFTFDNNTCENIYQSCKAVQDDQYDLISLSNVISALDNSTLTPLRCAKGLVDMETSLLRPAVCFKDCRSIVGFYFANTTLPEIDFSGFNPWENDTRRSPQEIAEKRQTNDIRAWIRREMSTVFEVTREGMENIAMLKPTRASEKQPIKSRQTATIYGYQQSSPALGDDDYLLTQINSYKPSGFAVVDYGKTTNLSSASTVAPLLSLVVAILLALLF